MAFSNLKKALDDFGQEWTRLMRLELGAYRKKPRRRTKWKKVGKGWKPKMTTVKYKKGNFVNTGTLKDSIRTSVVLKPDLSNFKSLVGVDYAEHGDYVRNGRKGKKNRGKQPPPPVIADWSKMRRIKLQDLDKGGFVKESKSGRKGLGFVMGRSIAYFGIEPFDFVGLGYAEAIKRKGDDILKALVKDLGDEFND